MDSIHKSVPVTDSHDRPLDHDSQYRQISGSRNTASTMAGDEEEEEEEEELIQNRTRARPDS